MKRVLLATAACLGAALAAVPSAAQPPCFAYRGVYQPPKVTYQAPTVGRLNYHVPVQKVVANDIAAAPLIVTVPVDSHAVPVGQYGSPYYYTVGDAYREKAYIRDVIREELRALVGGNPPQPTAPAGYPPKGPAAPQPGQATQPQPEADAIDDVTPPDLQQKVVAAYGGKGNCLGCHGNGQASGRFKLTNEAGQLLKKSSDKRWKIYGMASVGAMPPSAANDASKAMEAANLPVLLQYAAIK